MLKIDITTDEVSGAFERLLAANVDLTPLMREISEEMRSSVEENFEQQGRPQWKPLSPVTLARRGGDGKILQDSGILAGSIAADHDATSATVGTNVPYAKTMQFGAKKGQFGRGRTRNFPIPWGDIPPRPFLAVTHADQAQILDIIADYERRAARG